MRKIKNAVGQAIKHKDAPAVFKVADIAIKVGFSFAHPAAALYEISKVGLQKAAEYFQEKTAERVYEYHRHFLYKNDELDVELSEKIIEQASFNALLSCCVQDIEDRKTPIYANLTRAIAFNRVPQKLRRHFIFSLKEISWDEVDSLRYIYVLTKYSVVDDDGKVMLPNLNMPNGPEGSIERLIFNNLVSSGFILDYQLSEMGRRFIEACSSDIELTPEHFELRNWTKNYCAILHYPSSHNELPPVNYYSFAEAIQDVGMKSFACDRWADFFERKEQKFSNCFCIILREEDDMSIDDVNSLNELVSGRPCIKVLVTSSEEQKETRDRTDRLLGYQHNHKVYKKGSSEFNCQLVIESTISDLPDNLITAAKQLSVLMNEFTHL